MFKEDAMKSKASLSLLAPDGSLVIGLGQKTNVQLVQVEPTLLKIVSPVFKVMLGPSVSPLTT